MAASIEDVQPGWKVFAGSEELGKVEEIGQDELIVGKGMLVHHTYHVPADLVEDAAEGVVDLSVDRATIEATQDF